MISDEGFTDDDGAECIPPPSPSPLHQSWMNELSNAQRQELAYQLLITLPKTQLAAFHRSLAPKLKVDIVGSLPPEISLVVLSFLPHTCLLTCALVSKKWQTLANDQELWKRLCHAQNWEWKTPRRDIFTSRQQSRRLDLDVDEGVGEEEAGYSTDTSIAGPSSRAPRMRAHDSGFESMLSDFSSLAIPSLPHRPSSLQQLGLALSRFDKPSTFLHSRLLSAVPSSPAIVNANYKLLHQTHVLLNARMRNASFRMTVLPSRIVRS
ncbi:hypothetical protein BDV93DRAFT_554958 [Ceratobasidium sp. AG-I]|nr:hypothetical protein BDV93DRAFT_554958 [Ceratobasidium sp. AG-I]